MTIVNRRGLRNGRLTTHQAIHSFLSSLGTPKALAVWLLYSHNQHRDLLDLDVDPLHYNDAHRFSLDHAAVTLLSKAAFLDTSYDLRERAIEKFLKSEELCKETNRRIRPYTAGGWMPPSVLDPLIPRVQAKIERILGDFDFEEWVDSCDWGPGVSTRLKGSTSVKPNKYQQETGITQEVYMVFEDLLPSIYPSWHNEILKSITFTIEHGNHVTTVPKNSKTDRVIAIEPGFNLWFQKGLGTLIRRRLQRVGCDLNTQARNRKLASEAYARFLATIDFSSASDTIALEVCRLLLPRSWFRVLDLCRSKIGSIDGKHHIWEKFSSMGNGFTFELESLIFYAVGLAVLEESSHPRSDLTVFGDDVILPAYLFNRYHEIVQKLGFVVNNQKSYTSGCFYESCGKHYFKGTEVTPIFLKRKLVAVRDYYSFHNRVLNLASLSGLGVVLDSRFRILVKDLRRSVSIDHFFLVPQHVGDCGFHSNLDEAMGLSTTRFVRGIGWSFLTFTERAVKLPFDGYGLVLDRIRGTSTESKNDVALKGRTTNQVTRIMTGSGQWYYFGRWS